MVALLGTDRLVKEVQFLNADSPIELIVDGKFISFNDVQFSKAAYPIDVTTSESLMLVKEEHPEKVC